jgi:hypothetical protein
MSLFLVVGVGALGGLGTGAGCSHDARPAVQPADPPPPALPPASGTPIGYLIDAGELTLSDGQVTKLKVIDDDLAATLMNIDSVQRSASGPQTTDDSRGRMGVGLSTERNGVSEADAARQSSADQVVLNPGTHVSSSSEERAATLKRVPEARAYAVRTAIASALALLDARQQKLARQLLKDRGVDPDTGRFDASGEPGAARGSSN